MTKEITISPIATKIEQFSITNESTMEEAVILLSLANKELDKLTADKEKITKPLNDTLKEIRSRYKPAESRLEGAISTLRQLMTSYQTEKTAQAQLEAEKIASKVSKGKLKAETAMNQIALIDEPDQQVRTQAGMVSFKTVKKWRLIDINLVPRAFLTIDEPVVNANMKAGQKIEGIEYYTEQQPINRRS